MSPGAFKEDLFGGDHGEPAPHVLVYGVPELGPGPALDGALAEASVGELADAGGGGDLDLVSFLVELVLHHLLYPVVVWPDHLTRREEEVEAPLAVVVFFELSPTDLVRRSCIHHHGC